MGGPRAGGGVELRRHGPLRVASIPAMLFASPRELGCDDCPANVLLVRHDEALANAALGLQAVLYVALLGEVSAGGALIAVLSRRST